MKDFTFSDGMVVPAGIIIGSPILPLHSRSSALSNANVFDGFRYSRMSEENTGPTKYQMVNTSLDYLAFGHGKHVWYDYLILLSYWTIVNDPLCSPGRFLAVAEMKLIIASMILQYDLKLIPGTKPKRWWYAQSRIPELKLPILVKNTHDC